MPEEISQYRPTWLEKLGNTIRESMKYGHMKNVGPIDTGDPLTNERLFRILASLKDEVPKASKISFSPMGWLMKLSEMPVYEPRLGGSYNPSTREVEVFTKAKANPLEALIHELAHARTYGRGRLFSDEYAKNRAVVDASRSLDREYDEDVAYPVGRRLVMLATPYTQVRQQDFDRVYAEELEKIMEKIAADMKAGKRERRSNGI